MTKKSEFEKLLSETKLEINEVLDEKYSNENVSQIKQFDNIVLNQEDIDEEVSEDQLEWYRPGIQISILNKLKKIKRDYDFKEGAIDLHGENIKTAQLNINQHLEKCFYNNIRQILIITGKGTESISPLKKLVFVMLKKCPIVEAFCLATNHGGNGAFYVQIKN
tara:strand:+ start:1932 stop:2423 length:492 start_codon:yes stop_codon:yes gene_type:complete